MAKQYGIRIRQHTDMPWDEFCTLVGGLMSDTPLGQIVAIRSETDQKIIKSFNPQQRKIKQDWENKQAKLIVDDPELYKKQMEQLVKMLASMFSGKKVKKK